MEERRAAAGVEPDEEGHLSFETTTGRVFFNEALPVGYRYVNDVVGKRNTPIGVIVEELSAGEATSEAIMFAAVYEAPWRMRLSAYDKGGTGLRWSAGRTLLL